jgi:arsenite-transporting ATPase
MFSGKGGVGKTTLSCAFARFWAKQYPQEQILLISTDPAHSLGDVLQMTVEDIPHQVSDLTNLTVRALDAQTLLQAFKTDYGNVLELLVERGSFVQGEDLTPVWDLEWPGLDELMGILEIQRLLRDGDADRIVVDMAPSGHTLNLFGLMDFLDGFLKALDLFQEKHRTMSQQFTGRYNPDEADQFLQDMRTDLTAGRQLLQNPAQTACLVVAIPEPMSYLETQRFVTALERLQIPLGAVIVNRVVPPGNSPTEQDRYAEQQTVLAQFQTIVPHQPILTVPLQTGDPIGGEALDHLESCITQLTEPIRVSMSNAEIAMPAKLPPGFPDFLAEGRRLILVGGKGGVGKTTVAAAIALGLAQRHTDRLVRVMSIDPAHSLGDAFGQALGHEPTRILSPVDGHLTAQEVDADRVLQQFRDDYLWELAAMMSGESDDDNLTLAYGPEAWRTIVAQALPGIDEMLSLVTVMELLESQDQDIIILDTAPTGHLLRFLEMPTALGDWLAWIFKLWIKYQDVLGRTEFMGRLRTLRQRVMQAQKKLKDPQHTEFIGVVQAQVAIVAEAARLTQTLTTMGIYQHYLVHNRYEPGQTIVASDFPGLTIVRLPTLPRSIPPLARISVAADLLF